jgi:hypothetical protein
MKQLLVLTATASVLVVLGAACAGPSPRSEGPMTGEEAGTREARDDLKTYDGPAENIPVMARYPATMEVMGTGSGEGVGLFFTFKPQGNALDEAEVHVFLPANTSSTEALREGVTGPNGLMASSGWTLEGARAGADSEFPYSWLETVLDFSADRGQSGHILIGRSNGQPFRVTLLYPAAMADAYWPGARAILDSLQLDADALPITTSG